MRAKQTKTLDKNKILSSTTRQIIHDCLLKNMPLKEAAALAKVTYQHARRLATRGNINALVRQEIGIETLKTRAKTADLRDEATQSLVGIMRDPSATDANKIKCADVLGKMNGWHSQTTVLEAGSRQQQLTEAEREEARWLADLRFRPEYALMDTHRPMSAQDAQFEPANEGNTGCKADANQGNTIEPGLRPPGATPKPPSGPDNHCSPLSPENFWGKNIKGPASVPDVETPDGPLEIFGAENCIGEQNVQG